MTVLHPHWARTWPKPARPGWGGGGNTPGGCSKHLGKVHLGAAHPGCPGQASQLASAPDRPAPPPDQWRRGGLPRRARIGPGGQGRGGAAGRLGARPAGGAERSATLGAARAEVATLASPESAAAGSDGPSADGGGPGGGVDARGAGWGITAGLDPEMALLAEHLLKPLPADKQIETGPFLEAVSHLPPFFGEPG